MNLEFYAKTRFTKWHQVTWEGLAEADPAKHVVLVETEKEREFVEGLQYMLGCKLVTCLYDEDRRDLSDYLDSFMQVYTTWNPTDRNRI